MIWLEFLDVFQNLWPQFFGFFILVVFYKFGFIYREYANQAAVKDDDVHRKTYDYISCQSPNCVRCRAYTQKSMTALYGEWSKMIRGMDSVEKECVARITLTMEEYAKQDHALHNQTFRLLSLPTKAFYDVQDFKGDTGVLEQNWEKIHSEYLTLSELGGKNGWDINSTPRGRWTVFYLINQGKELKENTSKCPTTYRILQKLNGIMNGVIFGNVCFSVVYPKTHITEHYGPCNLRIRCHLGLDVPQECELYVDGDKTTWKKGKCTLFDDSYLHSVVHHGTKEQSKPRVIFLVDLWNPGLSANERTALSHLLKSTKLDGAA